jgi:DNA polymerase III delta prime subunit
MLWITKYKPTTTNEICGNTILIHTLKNAITNNINVVVSGDNGIGKTLTINCILDELSATPDDIFRLTALNDRSIKTIRNEVSTFVKHSSPRRKYIFVEDLDSMCDGSQHGLSGFMETHESITFILCANTYVNMIESLQSRCSFFVLLEIGFVEKKEYLTKILKQENVTYEDGVIERTHDHLKHDLRNTMLVLQNAVVDNHISVKYIETLLSFPFENTIIHIIGLTMERKSAACRKSIRDIFKFGYNRGDIIKFLFDYCVTCDVLEPAKKLQYLELIGETKISIQRGLFSTIQFDNLFVKLCELN